MTSKTAIIALGLFVAIFATPVVALEVYQWTDENGVIHFSQFAPGDHIDSVETLDVLGEEELGNGLGVSEDDDPYGYKAHREAMDDLWADMEERREAGRQRQAATPSTQIVYVREEAEYPYVYPGYGLRPPNRPVRPPHRPDPPVVKPVPYKRP